jgi:uncharacterized protein (TIGR02301 family)
MSPAPPFRRLIATLVAGGDCRLASHGAAAYLDPIIPASNRRIMARRILILALLGLFTLGTPARAQDSVAPYDATLQRLAEILGALHYLRGICGANEGQKWRNQMQALVDAEAPTGDRRTRMVASFNRGFRIFQQSYRTCTPAADLVIRRYLDEGSKIAREVTARYAN